MRNHGFTLIELSMVMVIIGMIIGAITIGSSLIRNSELQTIGSDYQKFIAAIKNFQDKYQGLPGDLPAATTYFTGTGNGNGNGQISVTTEQFRAWQHLALAKMVDGSFSGATAGAGDFKQPGTNIPKSQINGAGWGLHFILDSELYIHYSQGDSAPNHVLWLGGESISGIANGQKPVLTAEEAENIDGKFDDGAAVTGKILGQISLGGSYPDCLDGSFVYRVTSVGKGCALIFKTGY